MSIRNTRELEWIARELLFVRDSFRACRVGVFRIVRPVESVVESAALVAVVAESAALVAVPVITVRAVCDLVSHVVERQRKHLRMRIIRSVCQVFKSLRAPTRHPRSSVVDDMR